MNGRGLQFALREWARETLSPFALVVLAVATLVLTISGPFDTLRSLGPAPRAAYWALTCLASYGAAKTVARLLRPRLARVIASPRPRLFVRALILTVPAGGAAFLVHAGFFGWASPELSPRLLLQSATLTMAITLVLGLARERLAATAPKPPEGKRSPPAETRPALLERLPAASRGALIALSAEDHYVAVKTERGRALILMRLADAIREAAPTSGLQIHRSHWVALAAVKQVKREGGRLRLTLTDGSTLPVSRGYTEAVREAGLPMA